jgi:DNA-directed RNA polymerase subunit RPC12/RpoP
MTSVSVRQALANLPSVSGAGGVCGLHGIYSGYSCPQCVTLPATVRPIRGSVPYRCPVCGGRGTMPHDFYRGLGASNATGPVQCRSCGGRGIVYG